MARGGIALQREGTSWRLPPRCICIAISALLLAGLSGCADISRKFADAASQLPAVGLPAGAPERPAEPAAFPAVHDIPPPRNSVTLTNFEQQQLEDDLVAARDHQQTAAGVPLQPKKKPKDKVKQKAAAQPRLVPASGSASIY